MSNISRSVYNSLREEIFIEEICWTDTFVLHHGFRQLIKSLNYFGKTIIKIRESGTVPYGTTPCGFIVTLMKILQI